MRKSFNSFLNNSLTKISSLINSSLLIGSDQNENKDSENEKNSKDQNKKENDEKIVIEQENSESHDLDPSEDNPSLIFDDSLSFSKELIVEEKNHPISVDKSLIEELQNRLSHLEDELERSRSKIEVYEDKKIKNIENVNDSALNTVQYYEKVYEREYCQKDQIQKNKEIQRKEETTNNHQIRKNTSHILSIIEEKDKEIKNLRNELNESDSNQKKLEYSLKIMEQDLNRENEKKEALILLAEEKIESLNNVIESLRDQLEFEKEKNNKIRNDLNLSTKRCVEMVEIVQYLTNGEEI